MLSEESGERRKQWQEWRENVELEAEVKNVGNTHTVPPTRRGTEKKRQGQREGDPKTGTERGRDRVRAKRKMAASILSFT